MTCSNEQFKFKIDWEKRKYQPNELFLSRVIKTLKLLGYIIINFNTENSIVKIKKMIASKEIYTRTILIYSKPITYDEYDLIWNNYPFLIRENDPFLDTDTDNKPIILSSEYFDKEIEERLNNFKFVCLTYHQLLLDTFPFLSYKAFFTEKFEKWRQRKWGDENLFIPNHVNTKDSDQPVSAIDYINRWMKDDKRQALLLLGNFGTGKTTLINHVIADNLNRFQINHNVNQPYPILIKLEKIPKKASLQEIIIQHLYLISTDFQKEDKFINVSYQRIKFLIDIGKIILFFDAFDIMAYQMNWDIKKYNFNQLLSACEQEGKVVITCRTHYFEDEAGNPTQFYKMFVENNKNIEVIHLKEFEDQQVETYMKKSRPNSWIEDLERIKGAFKEKKIDEANKYYHIPKIIRRPLFLSMMVNSVWEKSKDITPADIYDKYVDKWLKREAYINNRIVFMKDTKLSLMMTISHDLWNKNKHSITISNIYDLSEKQGICKKHELAESELKNWISNSLSAPFLIKNDHNEFSFTHYSFIEFFVAKQLFTALKDTDINLLNDILSKRRIGKTIIYFLALMDRKLNIVTTQLRLILVQPYQHTISENILKILYWSARTQCDMFDQIDDMDRFKSQAASIMPPRAQLARAQLEGLDLEGAFLYRADLREADLRKANLNHADLTDANLNIADLSDAQLTNVSAENATFRDTILEFTDFRGANFSKCDFTGAAKTTKAYFDDTQRVDIKSYQTTTTYLPIVQRPHCQKVESFTYDHKNIICASGGADGLVILYRIRDKRILWVFEGHTNAVNALAFSLDDHLLVSGGGDGTVRVWDISNLRCRYIFTDHDDIFTVAVSPDGKFIAAGGKDQSVCIWKTATGNLKRRFTAVGGEIIFLAFSENNLNIISLDHNGIQKTWHINEGILMKEEPGAEIHVNRLPSKADELLTLLRGHRSAINSTCFSNDGRKLASVSKEDQTIRLWNLDTLEVEHHILAGPMIDIAFSPDGALLAAAGENKQLKLYSTHSGKTVRSFEGHTNAVSSVVFSPDGQTLISGGHDNTVRIWNIHTCEMIFQLLKHTDWVRSIAYSPYGDLLASGGWDYTIILWDMHTYQNRITLKGHTNRIITIAFSPDGNVLVSGSRDKTVRVWDVSTGAQRLELGGHTDSIKSVDISPDNEIIASGSKDNTIRLWDMKTGEPLGVLEGNLGHVYTVKFHLHDNYLVCAGEAGRLQFWDYRRKRPLLYSYCLGQEKWLNLLPDKRFNASSKGISYLGFIEKGTLQYHRATEKEINSMFYNPDAVANTLALPREG